MLLKIGVPYSVAWSMHPIDALELLGLSCNMINSNADSLQAQQVQNKAKSTGGKKLVAKYRKSKMKQT